MARNLHERLPVTTETVRERYVDIEAENLRDAATDVEWVILRVRMYRPNGRPYTRTLRLHADDVKRQHFGDLPDEGWNPDDTTTRY